MKELNKMTELYALTRWEWLAIRRDGKPATSLVMTHGKVESLIEVQRNDAMFSNSALSLNVDMDKF